MIRTAQALSGYHVSHEFSVVFLKLPRCPSWRHLSAVSSKRSVQRQRKQRKNTSSSRNGQRRCVALCSLI